MLSLYTVFLAFGSNLGDRIAHIEQAISLLREQNIISDIVTSGYYRSVPIDAPGDFYINSVIQCSTFLDPHELLISIHAIENDC